MKEELVFVDYENVQKIDLSSIKENVKMIIVVGVDQVKIPIELVERLQYFGKQIEWLKVHGKGKNALDFFIAYYLGVYITNKESENYSIYSNDKGYDPLINHLVLMGKSVKRITDLKSFQLVESKKTPKTDYEKVVQSLVNIDTDKRPKKEDKLIGHIKNIFGNKKSDDVILKIIETLKTNKVISIQNNSVKYSL